MNAIIISSRTDLIAYLRDVRADVDDIGITDAVTDQIQFSDHPAWGDDWSEWLEEWLPSIVEETIEGLSAIED